MSRIVHSLLTTTNDEIIDDVVPMTFMSVSKMLESSKTVSSPGLAGLAAASLARGTSHAEALKLIEYLAKQRCVALGSGWRVVCATMDRTPRCGRL